MQIAAALTALSALLAPAAGQLPAQPPSFPIRFPASQPGVPASPARFTPEDVAAASAAGVHHEREPERLRPRPPPEQSPLPQLLPTVAASTPAASIINQHVLRSLARNQNEVVCMFCLLQVIAAAYELGNGVVRAEIEGALQSPDLEYQAAQLHHAATQEKTLSGQLTGYYQHGAFNACAKNKNRRVLAAERKRRQQRCERINTFVRDRGTAVDFTHANTTQLINSQVERATLGEIPQLFSPLARDTKLVFASTLVFADMWLSRMITRRGQFHTAAGGERSGPVAASMLMLRETLPVLTGVTDGVIGVTLPYEHPAIRMFLFTMSDYQSNILDHLDIQHYRELSFAEEVYANVTLPRFDVLSKKRSYLDLLTQMGMTEMLSGGLGAEDRLKVGRLAHSAVMACDEHGTRAAGAAGIALVPLSAKPVPFQALMDRPFVAMLYHMDLGAPIFSTYVADPGFK